MKRVSFMIEPDLLERLRAMKARTSLSDAEQIRQAIRMWLDSHEWPPRRAKRTARDE
jgi:metal-responsive CopG/Arc/MetJ family transcriptional regulator